MDILEIIAEKSFGELDANELQVFGELGIDEAQFNAMKHPFSNLKKEYVHLEPKAEVKMKLDDAFVQLYPQQKRTTFYFVKWGSAVAATLVLLVGFFFMFKGQPAEQVKLAENKMENERLEEDEQVQAETEIQQTAPMAHEEKGVDEKQEKKTRPEVKEMRQEPMAFSARMSDYLAKNMQEEVDDKRFEFQHNAVVQIQKEEPLVEYHPRLKASSNNTSTASLEAYRNMQEEVSLETRIGKRSVRADAVQKSIEKTINLY